MHHGPDIIRVHPETVQGIGVVGVMIRIGSLMPDRRPTGISTKQFSSRNRGGPWAASFSDAGAFPSN